MGVFCSRQNLIVVNLLIIVVLWLVSLAGAHVDCHGAFSQSRCTFVECSATVSYLAGTIVYCCAPPA